MFGAVVLSPAYTQLWQHELWRRHRQRPRCPPPALMRGRELHRQVVEPFWNSIEGCPWENAKVSIFVQNEAVPQGALDSRGDIYHAKMTHAARSNPAISKAENKELGEGGTDGASHPERSGKCPQRKAGLDLFSEHGTERSRKDIQGRARETECWVYEGNPGKARPADSRVLQWGDMPLGRACEVRYRNPRGGGMTLKAST